MHHFSHKERLCKKCVKIPRPVYFNRSSNFPSRRIGKKREIEARKDSCPFCRLIYNAVFNNDVPYRVDDESNLGVIWNGEYYYFSASHGEDLSIKIAVIREGKGKSVYYGYARPVTEPSIDFGRIQSWLKLCREHHHPGSELQQASASASIESDSVVLPARVIDVQKGCIVPLTPGDKDVQYITLSYVWGQAAQYRLLVANKSQLMSDGFMLSPEVQEQLPRTIRYSMTVVSKLGLRFLWVDALCIVQDDVQDVTKEIYRMDAIYEGSVFTLVAASGTHADAGLAAIHARQGEQEYEIIWPGVRMTAIHDVQEILDHVKYGTRGWTFQEQVLSSRLLIFTDRMVHFYCHGCTWSEDSRADETPRQQTSIGNPRTSSHRVELLGDAWMPYCMYLDKYSQRDLTDEGDRIKAMMGILQRVRRSLNCHLVDGLLSDSFEWGLSFYVNSCQRCPLFPSYSWAGWKGRVLMEWPNGLDYESETESDEETMANIGTDPESQKALLDDFEAKAALHVAQSTWIVWYERLPQQEPQFIVERDGLEERQLAIQTLKSTLFTDRGRMKDDLQRTQPTRQLAPDLEMQLPKHHSVLQFWTVSLTLRMRKFGVASKHLADLYNAKDVWCGQLQLPEDLDLDSLPESTAELLLLSVTRDHGLVVENSKMFNGISDLAPGKRNGSPPQYYRVMWIKRRGGLAERVAVGEIHYRALRRPVDGRAEWKEIILA